MKQNYAFYQYSDSEGFAYEVRSVSNGHEGFVSYGENAAGFPEQLGSSDLTTAMQAREESIRKPCHYTGRGSWYRYDYPSSAWVLESRSVSGSVYLMGSPAVIEDNDTTRLCETKLYSNIYEAQAGSQSGVLLGELRSTLKTIRNPISAVTKAAAKYRNRVRAAKRRHEKAPSSYTSKELLDYATQQWLEFTYAISPLINDVENHIDHISDLLNKVDKKVVTASQETTSYSKWTVHQFVGYPFRGVYKTRTKTVTSAKGNAQIRVDLDATPPIKSFGFRGNDIIPTIYQLIPYSFVLDYFTNVGNVINSIFVETSAITYAWVTTKQTSTVEFEVIGELDWAAGGIQGSGHASLGGGESTDTTYARRSVGSFVPIVRTESPTAGQLFNVSALAYALTL